MELEFNVYIQIPESLQSGRSVHQAILCTWCFLNSIEVYPQKKC